jgi:hypothetical protein
MSTEDTVMTSEASTPSPDTTSGASSAPEVTSSPADTSAEPQPSQPGDQTASPPAAPADTKETLLDAVKKVLEPKADNPGGEAAAAQGKEGTDPNTATPPTDAELEDEPPEEELKGMAAKTRRRVQALLKQRSDLRGQLDALKTPADRWNHFDGFLRQNKLAAEDVNMLLGIGASLRRNDHASFLKGVMPYVTLAQEALGLVVAKDFQPRIEAGEMSEAVAKQMTAERLKNLRLQNEADFAEKNRQTEAQQRQAADTARSLETAINNWEAGIKAQDPDYDRKATMVMRASEALILRRGRPNNVQAAVALAKAAYDEVNADIRRMAPAPRPTAPAPAAAARSTMNGASHEPKSMREAAEMALQRMRERAN